MNFYAWVLLHDHDAAERAHEALRRVFTPERVFPGAGLSLRITPAFSPSELLRHGPFGPPRLTLLELESDEWRGRILGDEALQALREAPMGPVARGGLAWAQDAAIGALSRRFGGALALAWQEDPDLAYAAVARQGRLQWSLAVSPPDTRVRYDGERIERREGFDRRDAVDRVEVLREGLQRLLGEPLRLDEDERLTLPDQLAEWLLEAEERPL